MQDRSDDDDDDDADESSDKKGKAWATHRIGDISSSQTRVYVFFCHEKIEIRTLEIMMKHFISMKPKQTTSSTKYITNVEEQHKQFRDMGIFKVLP